MQSALFFRRQIELLERRGYLFCFHAAGWPHTELVSLRTHGHFGALEPEGAVGGDANGPAADEGDQEECECAKTIGRRSHRM